MFSLESLDENDLQAVYHFVDKVPISKTKKNLNRDFSDCSLMAEVVKHYLPHTHKGMIEVHNYVASSQVQIKIQNWKMLNKKILLKLGPNIRFKFSEIHIKAIVNAKQGAIERALL